MEKPRVINTMIAYNSYEEYLQYKDADIKEIAKLMNARSKEKLQQILEQKAVVQTLSSDKVGDAIATQVERIIQDELRRLP